MIIFRESVKLEEILQSAGKAQLDILQNQMANIPELKQTLTTPMGSMSKYKYLTDNTFIKGASLLLAIEFIIQQSHIRSFFIKNTKGLYVGFIGVVEGLENGKSIVEDIKMFSFGLPANEDENMMRKDAPHLLDQCLKKYSKVRWESLKDNRANISYEIYRKKHNGVRNDLGNKWEYICYGKD
jgi:hypothetical protein